MLMCISSISGGECRSSPFVVVGAGPWCCSGIAAVARRGSVLSKAALRMFLSLSETVVDCAFSIMREVKTVDVMVVDGVVVESRPVACWRESAGPGLSASPIRSPANSWTGRFFGVDGCALGSVLAYSARGRRRTRVGFVEGAGVSWSRDTLDGR